MAAADANANAVHMRFSVETPTLRVVSHEPAHGQLDLTPQQDGTISARLPEGVSQAVVVNGGETRAVDAVEGYIQVEGQAGQTSHVHYTLPERVAAYEVGTPGKTASCIGHWRGETLMRVEPAGPFYPLYQRIADLPPVQPSLPAGTLISSLDIGN